MFLSVFSYGQFSVLVDQMIVDNQTSSTISFGNKESVNVSLHVLVNATSFPSDSFPGTINVYYKKSSSSPAVTPLGGSGGNLLFLGGTQAGRTFAIQLDAAQFDNIGGILYVEYKSYSNVLYKSNDIAITKTPTTPTTPISSSNVIVVDNISYIMIYEFTINEGDVAPLLVGSQVSLGYGYEWQKKTANEDWTPILGVPLDWSAYYPGFFLKQQNIEGLLKNLG